MSIKYTFPLLFGFVFLFASCNLDKTSNNQQNTSSETDWHSQSNANDIQPSHLKLDIQVDFNQSQIYGSAQWTIEPKAGIQEAIFDTWKLEIDSVFLDDGTKTNFEIGEEKPFIGAALKVNIKPETRQLTIFYKSSKDAMALQWLTPEQTFGKKHPYLYTQGEPVYTRTWIPSPDGPGYRFTYDATVHVPRGLTALMSAQNPQTRSDDGVYHFKMEEKIPAYLMALAVGDISFSPVDERTGVYAEPAILDKARKELSDIGELVNIAEGLYGKYRWGRYDVLMLPSGFPIGGMENPRLTFATPTILAGDKSLLNLIAHELAHSWSGNLVTNATWEDFWLNEGFTVYFERRITEAQHGKDYVAMLWDLGLRELKEEIKYIEEGDTKLKTNLKDRDPGLSFTDIPYEKGAAFLFLIEQSVGREKWDAFLLQYFEDHAFQTISTKRFLEYLDAHLIKGDKDLEKKIDINTWVFGEGIPDSWPKVENTRFKKIDEALKDFQSGQKAEDLNAAAWSTHEWLHFLGELPENIGIERMKELDAAFNFTETENSEIADMWFLLALKNNYEKAYAPMKAFLNVTGRMKFLEPLYREMVKTEKGRQMADKIYTISKNNYHPITCKSIEKILDK